jgi:hypothetical protein
MGDVMKAASCGGLLILLFIGLPFVAHGSIVYRYDFGSLTTDSGLVAVADVVRSNGTYSPAGSGVSGIIFQLNILEVVKGSQFSTFYVVDGNSTPGDPSSGSPSIQVGSRYVLFLFATDGSGLCPTYPAVTRCLQSFMLPSSSNETWGIVGGPQGKFLVTNGLVYGFKTLYPQLYGSMTVDANGVPLDSFVAQVRSTNFQNNSLFFTIPLLPLVVSLVFLRRPRVQRNRSGKLALSAISIAIVAASLYFLLRQTPLSIFNATNFWIAFLGFAGVMGVLLYFMPGTLLERRPHVSAKWKIATILAAFSPFAIIIVLLFQAGDTMFEKDFYTIALIDGLLLGSIFGASIGVTIKTLLKKTQQKIETQQGQNWSANSPVVPA